MPRAPPSSTPPNLSGTNADSGTAIAVDAFGNAYVTGFTASANFPTTAGALQTTRVGPQDAFVTKLNPTGTSPLFYSTYLGGADDESGNAIAVDTFGNAYVTGDTLSADFPTTDGATRQGKADAFVTTLNTTGSALLYSTYLGGVDKGAGREGGNGIAVDTTCNIYVTGVTRSVNFPLLPPPPDTLQPAFGGGGDDGFVTKIGAEACPPGRISLLKEVVTLPPYTIGSQVIYQYTLKNESNVPLTNPRVNDIPVADVTCGSFTGTPETAVCMGTYTIEDRHVDASRQLTNTAIGRATLPNGMVLSSDPDSLSLPVVLAGQLGVSKSATPDPALAGEEVTFTLTAVNATGAPANVVVTDVIPSFTTFVSATAPEGWTVIKPDVGAGGGTTVTFTNSMMPVGNSPPLILVVRVNDKVPPAHRASATMRA